jgi:hypothetical protein
MATPAASVVRTPELTLRTECPACRAAIEVYGPHLSVGCACGQRVGVPTAVIAAPIASFDDEGPSEGSEQRGNVVWRWTIRSSTPVCGACGQAFDVRAPPARCGCGAELRSYAPPSLLLAQVPHVANVLGGDRGERSTPGGPRWWLVLDGPGRAEKRRERQQERARREATIDALRLEEFHRSRAEAERHKKDQDERRVRERDQHVRQSYLVLALAWMFVAAAVVGMASTTSLVMMETDLGAEPIVVVFTRLLLVATGTTIGVFALVASSAAAAYRVHEPLLAYVGFSLLVALGASIPGLGLIVGLVYAVRLALGLDPTLRGVRRTTPGGGRPMAVALVAFCVTAQFGVAAVWGSTFQEIWSVLSEDLARLVG